MSHRVGPYHNIWAEGCASLSARYTTSHTSIRRNQDGYTLVALLALMTVIALFAVAAAPGIRQQAVREREVEAIFRGEQVSDAIRAYYANQRRVGSGVAALPTSIDKLLEGLPSGTRKVQILRPSAARDPLSESGEWRLVRPRSLELSDFVQALMLYSENVRPQTNDPQLKLVEQDMAPPVLPTLGIASSSSDSSIGDNSTGPFIGVASESNSDSVLHYYGIARHRDWIFTPLFR